MIGRRKRQLLGLGYTHMEIRSAATRDAFLSLKQAWEQCAGEQPSWWKSWDWQNLFLSFHSSSRAPLILTAFERGSLIALLPLCIKNGKYRGRSLRILEVSGIPYSTVRTGLWQDDQEACAAGTAFAQYVLRQQGELWDAFITWDLDSRDALMAYFLAELRRNGCYQEEIAEAENYRLDLTPFASLSDYYYSLPTSFRRIVRRGTRLLGEAGSFCLVRMPTTISSAELGMKYCADIRAASWKAPEQSEDFFRHLGNHLARANRLRLFFLCHKAGAPDPLAIADKEPFIREFLDGVPEGFTPIAVNLYIMDGATAFYSRTHYRQDRSQYSAGIVLTWHSLRYMLTIEKVKLIDFQRGGQDYKKKFGGTINTMLYSYCLLNPRLRLLNTSLRLEARIRSLARPAKRHLEDLIGKSESRREEAARNRRAGNAGPEN